ncbi:hypothetical protein [Granulicella arctica]|uniref:hypothetical protein n=1 Tax=Granulicella arctica TaxID=940613 RepID=UPI0021E0529A|nr:hypothetical protein [Granulicella arctica]
METAENFKTPGQVESDPTSVPSSTVERIAITIVRYLVDFLMTWGGLNAFLDLAYHPSATLLVAKQYMEALLDLPYMVKVAFLQAIAGILLLIKCFVALALTVLAAINFNTTLYHATSQSKSSAAALVVYLLCTTVFMGHRVSFTNSSTQAKG